MAKRTFPKQAGSPSSLDRWQNLAQEISDSLGAITNQFKTGTVWWRKSWDTWEASKLLVDSIKRAERRK